MTASQPRMASMSISTGHRDGATALDHLFDFFFGLRHRDELHRGPRLTSADRVHGPNLERPVGIELERDRQRHLAPGSGAKARELELPEVHVVLEVLTLALGNAHVDEGLEIPSRREDACVLAGNLRVARDHGVAE